ncbi:uncharacterized protein LOC121429856 [Lytechinus variegatus]|uniref:uncharacterized protein LOC121429856 n=1 Tax=Lytechinus variegatus TaxID=7654 RepID=UPI001BB16056|nr:uncharacterized protein LOC121429856 [Lytechinus variegatus]
MEHNNVTWQVIACLLLLIILNIPGNVSHFISEEIELSTNCQGDDSNCIVEHRMETSRNNDGGLDVYVDETMRLPISALTEILQDISKVCIVNIDTDISRGLQIVERPGALYQGRLQIKWDIIPTSHGWGILVLHLMLRNLEYGDHRHLHLEARTDRTLYRTPVKRWFPDLKKLQAQEVFRSTSTSETTKLWTTAPNVDTTVENMTAYMSDDLVQHQEIQTGISTVKDMIWNMTVKLLIVLAVFIVINVLAWTINIIYKLHKSDKDRKHVYDIVWRGEDLHVYPRKPNEFKQEDTQLNQEMQHLKTKKEQDLFIPSNYTMEAFPGESDNLNFVFRSNPS